MVSLVQFVKEGRLGELCLGMPAEEVRWLLGPPDSTGGTSRRYPRPCIYVYGSVEVGLNREAPYTVSSLHWQACSRGALRLADGCADESLAANADQAAVAAWLAAAELPYDAEDRPFRRFLVPFGVVFTFDEDGRLWSVSVAR